MFQIRAADYHLHQHSSQTLTDTGRPRIDMQLVVFLDDQLDTARIRDPDADAGILHGAGQTYRLSGCSRAVILLLHCFQRLHQSGGFVHDLSVGQYASRTDGIAVSDLPWSDPDLVRHHI